MHVSTCNLCCFCCRFVWLDEMYELPHGQILYNYYYYNKNNNSNSNNNNILFKLLCMHMYTSCLPNVVVFGLPLGTRGGGGILHLSCSQQVCSDVVGSKDPTKSNVPAHHVSCLQWEIHHTTQKHRTKWRPKQQSGNTQKLHAVIHVW